MTDFDLRFQDNLSATHPVDLTFGANTSSSSEYSATLNAEIAPPELIANVGGVTFGTLSAAIDPPVCEARAEYDNAVYRGVGRSTDCDWSMPEKLDAFREDVSQKPASIKTHIEHVMSSAKTTTKAATINVDTAAALRTFRIAGWGSATQLNGMLSTGFDVLTPNSQYRSQSWCQASSVEHDAVSANNELLRKPRVSKSARWVLAQRMTRTALGGFGLASRKHLSRETKWGEASRPNYGRYVKPNVVIPPDNGYKPPSAVQVGLLFVDQVSLTTDLIFGVKQYVPAKKVIPVKRAYIVINTTDLRVLETKERIETFSMDMSIDVESWTWGFSATVAKSDMSKLTPTGPRQPVVVDATINGQHFHFAIESISRSRSFGKDAVTVSGRGLSATLADPYSPAQTFTNTQERTAQQLMNDVLTVNGVPLGWSVDWRIDDWLVPSGAWSHQGTFMSAVTTIATSVGAFVQPDPVAKVLRILSRNKVKPWLLSASVADIEIPSAVVVTESTKWEDRAVYDSLYVSGTTANSVLGLVRRTGSAGDTPAPMVTDPLITSAVAARQRGIFELSKFGAVQNRELSLPVLPESGVILPGTIVKYTDNGISTTGVVQGVRVNVTTPSVRQQISLTSYD